MTAPLAIVDGNLVAGEVTVLDTLLPESQEPTANLPESQEPTANHSSERISPSQPEEMPPGVPPSAVVCGDIPPPKAAARACRFVAVVAVVAIVAVAVVDVVDVLAATVLAVAILPGLCAFTRRPALLQEPPALHGLR